MATNQTPKRTRKTGDEFAQLLEAHHDLLGELPPPHHAPIFSQHY
ncbi:hypothetical protein ACFPVT_03820 [Corynebacterium choanae]|nr:hypothetical protein [Corynebacterium choanae]